MKTPDQILHRLGHFTGSDTFHKWSPLFRKDLATDGVIFLAEEAGAYWLLDLIASHQLEGTTRGEDFQVWYLTKKTEGAQVHAEDGNDNEIARQNIEYTDFPLDTIKLFAVRNELGGITIMLPGEY